MEKRICPKCNSTWYSANTRSWKCDNCAAEIPPISSDNKNIFNNHRPPRQIISVLSRKKTGLTE